MGVPYLVIFLLGEWLLHGGIMAQLSLPGKTRSCKVSVKIRQISFHAFYRVFRARWKMCEYLYLLDRLWTVGLNILSARPISHCTVAEPVCPVRLVLVSTRAASCWLDFRASASDRGLELNEGRSFCHLCLAQGSSFARLGWPETYRFVLFLRGIGANVFVPNLSVVE